MIAGTTAIKYANFLFQSPDWGLNSASRNREIRRLLPWIHFHFTQCSPCEKQADIISAIDIVKHSPCGFAGGICIYRRNNGDKCSNFPLQPPDWGFAPCPRAPSTAEVLLKGEYCIARCKFSGTSKWNPGHARPRSIKNTPIPLKTIHALRAPSKSMCTHMRC